MPDTIENAPPPRQPVTLCPARANAATVRNYGGEKPLHSACSIVTYYGGKLREVATLRRYGARGLTVSVWVDVNTAAGWPGAVRVAGSATARGAWDDAGRIAAERAGFADLPDCYQSQPARWLECLAAAAGWYGCPLLAVSH